MTNRKIDSTPPQPNFASVEADVLGAILGFHGKVTMLLRDACLDGERVIVVTDRIKTLLDDVVAAMKQTRRINLRDRLELAYEEVKGLVAELSQPQDGGSDKKAKPRKHRSGGQSR